jgi:hypothetical protein
MSQLEELEDEFKSPVHEMMSGSYFYAATSVGKSRKFKRCTLCYTEIPVGSASKGAKLFHNDFYQVDFCSKCEETYKIELAEMSDGKLDDYS